MQYRISKYYNKYQMNMRNPTSLTHLVYQAESSSWRFASARRSPPTAAVPPPRGRPGGRTAGTTPSDPSPYETNNRNKFYVNIVVLHATHFHLLMLETLWRRDRRRRRSCHNVVADHGRHLRVKNIELIAGRVTIAPHPIP